MVNFLRELSIGINYIEITVELAICLYFIKNYLRDRINGSFTSFLGFLSLVISRGFYIIFDYYIIDNIFRYMAWVFFYLGIIFLTMSLFKGASKSIFQEFPYKRIYFSSIIIYIFIVFIIRQLNYIASYISIIGMGVLLLIPLIYKIKKLVSNVGGYVKRYFGIAVFALPFSFLSISIGSIWLELPEINGWILKITTHVMFLSSLILFAMALWSLPTLNEFEWEKTLSYLYIILPNGVCAYSYSFKRTQSIDPQILGSGLTGIVSLVKEMTKSKKRLVFIKQEMKNLYVDYGNYVKVAVLAEEELKTIFIKIAQFIREFELIFYDALENWNGDLSIFDIKILNMLIRQIFGETQVDLYLH